MIPPHINPSEDLPAAAVPVVTQGNRRSKQSRYAESVGGLTYMTLALACMVGYIVLLAPSLTNDLYWPKYNRTGFAAYLVDVLNDRLQTTGAINEPQVVDLLAPDAMMRKSYASDLAQASFDSGSSRRVLYTSLNDLPHAIRDIRTTSAKNIAYIYGHYCWVDFDRRWSIAHSRARELRCLAKYTDNAAAYVETIMRNTNWTDFMREYGPPWTSSVGRVLKKTPEGRRWLQDREEQGAPLSIQDEVAFLQQRNIKRFTLQYQNDVVIGVAETIDLESAINQRQTIPLQTMPMIRGPWTSVTMYWCFRNDMWMADAEDLTIVRGDSKHLETIGWDFSFFFGLNDANNRYLNQPGLFYNNIGPFGSVDLMYVSSPPALAAVYAQYRTALNKVLWIDPALTTRFLALSEGLTLFPLPPNFARGNMSELAYHGGNLMCRRNSPTPFPQTQYAFDDGCTQTRQLKIVGSNHALLFALFAQSQQSNKPDMAAICALQTKQYDEQCIATLTDMADILKTIVAAAPDEFRALDFGPAIALLPPVQLTQFAKNTSTNDWIFLQQPLLVSTDVNWSFYGWLTIFDWIQGKREVIQFEGDVSTVFAMSEVNPTTLLPLSSQRHGDQSGPKTVFYLVAYTTVSSIALGVVVYGYAAWNALNFAGINLLAFNQVASFVWIGRPLLLLRGLTAMLVLSSTTTSLVFESGYSKFTPSRRSFGEILLISAETTWVSAVAIDALLIGMANSARFMSPLACMIAWIVTICIEAAQPVSFVATLDRQCVAINTNLGLECTVGTVQAGEWPRIQLLLAVQGGAVVLAGVLAWVWRMRRHSQYKKKRDGSMHDQAPLLIHGAAQSFLHCTQGGDNGRTFEGGWQLDDVACVLTGLLPFSWRQKQYTFDVKLWVLKQDNEVGKRSNHVMSFKRISLNDKSASQVVAAAVTQSDSTWKSKIMQLSSAVGACFFLIVTVVGSVSYIELSTVNFANDFYWATFNMTGHHTMAANWFNDQLTVLTNLPAVRLDEPRWTAPARNYSNPKLTTTTMTLLGSVMQMQTLAKLEVAIDGLRHSDPCGLPWISTQYCWVDFGRRWPLANSAARQRRCLANDATNGAVYLEAVLRNVNDWDKWTTCWGQGFAIAIGNELESTSDGRAWLRRIQGATPASLPDEVGAWRDAGLDKFDVQWQNYKQIGLVNTYSIENALGVQYQMTLTQVNGSFTIASQTSFKMYWGFASDLWAVSDNRTVVGGKSLVATSANYAFANVSMFNVLVQNRTLSTPLSAAFDIVTREIGPFGSTDMKIIPCPRELKALLSTGSQLVRHALATQPAIATTDYFNITLEPKDGMPTVFKQLNYTDRASYGGSILCPDSRGNDVRIMLRLLTRRNYMCGQVFSSGLKPTQDAMMLSVVATGLVQGNSAQLERACWHVKDPSLCTDKYMDQAISWVQKYMATSDVNTVATLASAAVPVLRQLNITIMQYVRPTSTSMQMLRATLFDLNDPSYDIWSWFYVFSWAISLQEVVRFEGDMGAINILMDDTGSSSLAVQPQEMPTTFATLARAGVQYVTGVILVVAACVFFCILASRGRIEGLNMLDLNRVAGMVWVGRPLLFLRGLTALCLLSTATLDIQVHDSLRSSFYVPLLPWYTAISGASEVTWLVYILNDIVTVWTNEYTQYYAPVGSLFVWIVAAIFTLVQPVTHSAIVNPKCQVDEMDFQLVCDSGVVQIGDVGRLYTLLGIIAACNLVSYVAVVLVMRAKIKAQPKGSLLLSSGAKHFFQQRRWVHHDVYYMDAASALLNGLLTFHWGPAVHVMDVKLWRYFCIQQDDDIPPQYAYALPLKE